MNKLKDFENELNACSKCGLCQRACPIYKLTQNECAVSKGKFIMLHGVTKGELSLSKNIDKYLDLCTKCEKCNDFCPSGINVCKILNTAKYEYSKNTFSSKLVNFLQSKYIFNSLIKILGFFTKFLRPSRQEILNPQTTVVYFKGCVNNISPSTDKYISKIFKNVPIKIIEPDFECCGLPFLSEGNLERFEDVAKGNLSKIPATYDYFITDCASCENTVLSYPDYIQNSQFIQKNKSVNWGDLIAVKGIKFKFNKPLKVTFHKPCHLKSDVFFKQIMKNCENVEYVEMENYDECCGLAGTFAFKNSKISKEMILQKAQNVTQTQTDYVITTCPACVIGLKYGLFLNKNTKTKAVSLLEFLAKADEIEYKNY